MVKPWRQRYQLLSSRNIEQQQAPSDSICTILVQIDTSIQIVIFSMKYTLITVLLGCLYQYACETIIRKQEIVAWYNTKKIMHNI